MSAKHKYSRSDSESKLKLTPVLSKTVKLSERTNDLIFKDKNESLNEDSDNDYVLYKQEMRKDPIGTYNKGIDLQGQRKI